ncbi:tetratricopeptide repeat protein 33-like isoform X2 [Dysidea avara]
MSSFGWKRKATKLNTTTVKAFTEEEANDEDVVDDDAMFEWIEAAKRRKLVLLEDCRTKSERLMQEGTFLAENGRYWEAVKHWNEALQLTPTSAVLYEMKSQALQELQEVFPAVESALKATEYQPNWSIAWQTLGRAQLGLREVYLAQKSFERCLHLDPSNRE